MADWMQGAVKHPGGLHKALHVPMGKKIPLNKIDHAAKEGGKLGRMANLAKTFEKYRP